MTKSTTDPLNPNNLEFRLKLFRIVCLPSILSQIDQNFTWIILIDKHLQAEYRQQLKILIKQKNRIYLHEYDENEKLGHLDWMQKYFSQTPDYVITTNLDDDDALPRNFVSAVKSHVHEVERNRTLPPIKLIGAKQIVQWDLVTTPQARLGRKCSWHRGQHPSSCGFSLLCQYPFYKLSVLSMNHKRAEEYFDLSIPPSDQNVIYYRNLFGTEALMNWSDYEMFYDISGVIGPVLMTNHFRNTENTRLYERKLDCEKVIGPTTFPSFSIDWNFCRNNLRSFSMVNVRYLKSYVSMKLQSLSRKLSALG